MLGLSLTALLAACASPSGGLQGMMLSEQRLNELLAAAFPHTRSLSGLAELTLDAPRLRLIPEQNRLGTALGVGLAERVLGNRVGGNIDLDYGLRFDAEQGAIRMTDVRVRSIGVDGLSQQNAALVSRYAPLVAEQLLTDFTLYTVPSERLALARSLGLAFGSLRVLPTGVSLDLAPAAR